MKGNICSLRFILFIWNYINQKNRNRDVCILDSSIIFCSSFFLALLEEGKSKLW